MSSEADADGAAPARPERTRISPPPLPQEGSSRLRSSRDLKPASSLLFTTQTGLSSEVCSLTSTFLTPPSGSSSQPSLLCA